MITCCQRWQRQIGMKQARQPAAAWVAKTRRRNCPLADKPTSWYSTCMSNDTAQRILDSAQTLIVERGYKGFSYADIAEVVNVSKPSIHFHYATKAVLVQQLVLRYREGTMAKLGQLSAQ